MGNYLTTTELLTRFPDDNDASFFTDDEGSGTPITTKLDDIIETAEGLINSRLAMRYATPVDVSIDTELGNTLERMTLDLAEGLMISGRSERISDAKQAQMDRVLDWADRIAKGELVLPGGVTPAGPSSRAPRASWTGSTRTLSSDSPRLFTRESMRAL